MQMSKLMRLALLIAVLLSAFSGGAHVSAQAGTTFFITDVDASQFPTVAFRLRAVDLNNRVVAGLNDTNLTLYENGQQVPAAGVQVTPHDDGPVTFIFLIDQGRLSNFQAFGVASIRQVFSRLVESGVFVNGRDTLEVMVRENINSDRTEPRLGPTQQGSDLITWISNYPFERRSANSTKGLEGVADAIAEMGKLVLVAGSQPSAILLLTRSIEEPANNVAITAAQNQATDAKAKYIALYTLQTDLGQTNKQPLEILAATSNGQYVALTRNTTVTSVDAVYQSINAQRLYYTVTYQSGLGEAGPRTLTVNSPTAGASGVVGSYDIAPQPPAVTLESPKANTTITRDPLLNTSGALVYSPVDVTISASVTFPDGYLRALQSAQLLVDGEVMDTVQLSPDATTVKFEANLSDITTPGSNPVTLGVRVVDALGLEGAAETTLTVEVILPPPTPSPTPPGLLDESPGLVLGGAALAICVVGLVVAAAVGGGVYYYMRRRSAPSAAAKPPAEAQRTLLMGRAVQAKVLATLTVLEGPKGLMGEAITIIKPTTTIGRNPNAADITFYADEESSVSRRHCTLQHEGGAFQLTDNGSSSGTRLNARAIQPNTPVVLADNDEIVLGDLARRGVKLRFNIVRDQGQLKYTGLADDRTMIVSRPPEDEPPAK
jgi:hypothetical protein